MIDAEVLAVAAALIAVLQRKVADTTGDLASLDLPLTPGLQLETQKSQVQASQIQVLQIDGSTGLSANIASGPGTIVGVILRAGAADTTLKLFDTQGAQATGKELPGVRTSTWDGYINAAIQASNGLLAILNQADAFAWVLFIPQKLVPGTS
jgi:hypothetical protein